MCWERERERETERAHINQDWSWEVFFTFLTLSDDYFEQKINNFEMWQRLLETVGFLSVEHRSWNTFQGRWIYHRNENRGQYFKHYSLCVFWLVSHGESVVYIVGSRGSSQLGGSLLGIPLGYKANKLIMFEFPWVIFIVLGYCLLSRSLKAP